MWDCALMRTQAGARKGHACLTTIANAADDVRPSVMQTSEALMLMPASKATAHAHQAYSAA